MNKIYKLIWNHSIGAFVVGAEHSKARGKQSVHGRMMLVSAIMLGLGAPVMASTVESQSCSMKDGQPGIMDAKGVCTKQAGPSGRAAPGGSTNYFAVDNDGGGLPNVAVGSRSIAAGYNANAMAVDAAAVGHNAVASAAGATAVGGVGARALGVNSTALGTLSDAEANGSTAIGNAAWTRGVNDIAIGTNARADSSLMPTSATSNTSSMSIGANSYVDGGSSVVVGHGSWASVNGDLSIDLRSTVVGNAASAAAAGSTVLGHGAWTGASATDSVALGRASSTNRANTVSVGNGTLKRTVANVAAGTLNNDAVNVGQLRPAVTALGGGATVDATTGAVTGPTYTVQGGTQTTVGAALDALDTGVNTNRTDITNLTGTVAGNTTAITNLTGTVNGNTTAITNLTGRVTTNEGDIVDIYSKLGGLADGTAGLVTQDATSLDIGVAANTGGNNVNFAGLDGARVLSGVAEGTLSATSDQAVNGAQLFATNQNVTNLDGRVTTNEGDISNIFNQLGELSGGTAGLVTQDATSLNIGVAATTGGNSVNFAGLDGARVLSGVAEGALSATSDQAVNGAQLFATNQNVTNLQTDMTNVKTDIVNIKQSLSDLGEGSFDGAVMYEGADKGKVTMGGAVGTIITNVAGGVIAPGSMDAVNGGQLAGIRDGLQDQIDGLNDRVAKVEAGGGGGGGGGPITDNGGKPIHNVGTGVAPSDAANVGQVTQQVKEAIVTANNYTDSRFNELKGSLDKFKGEVNDRFRRQDAKIGKIGAMSAANTQMAINAAGVGPGNGRVAAGVGYQSGQKALAVGYAKQLSDSTRFSLGGAFSGTENSVGAGIGIDL